MAIIDNNTEWQYPKDEGLIGDDHLWLVLTPMKILPSQTAAARSSTGGNIPAMPDGGRFKLLMPDQFSTSLSHQWEPYEGMAARLAETLSKYYKGYYRIASLLKSAGSITNIGFLNAFADVGSNEKVINTRVDSPLVYKNSAPREYNLSFEFTAYKPDDTTYLMNMVSKLMELSCPSDPASDGGFQQSTKQSSDLMKGAIISPPHIFKVKSITSKGDSNNNILKMKAGAITSIQPTYAAPFRNGGAFKVGLTISIIDITPLFDKSLREGSSVSVSPAMETGISFMGGAAAGAGNVGVPASGNKTEFLEQLDINRLLYGPPVELSKGEKAILGGKG